MILFPAGLTKTMFPGYYWHVEKQELYSIKVGGVLRKLPLQKPNFWKADYHYSLSIQGRKRHIRLQYFQRLKLKDGVIGYMGE